MPFFYLHLPGTKIVTFHLRYIHTPVTQNQTIQTHKYLIASNYGRSCLVASGNSIITKQVDILISKSQTLQHYTLNIMYINFIKLSWIRNQENP